MAKADGLPQLAALLQQLNDAGAAENVQKEAVKQLLKPKERKSIPPTDKFLAVIQADFPEQMDVLRWLVKDPYYTVIVALHDRDTYEATDMDDGQETHKRTNGDGTESEFRPGDVKPAHYHLIIKTRTKIRATALQNRFCGQVHFEAASDAQEYARYLTHSTFAARNKHQYNADEAILPHTPASGWKLYTDLISTHDADEICDIIEDFAAACETMNKSDIVVSLAKARNVTALKSIMAHGYFYDKILCPAKAQDGKEKDYAV